MDHMVIMSDKANLVDANDVGDWFDGLDSGPEQPTLHEQSGDPPSVKTLETRPAKDLSDIDLTRILLMRLNRNANPEHGFHNQNHNQNNDRQRGGFNPRGRGGGRGDRGRGDNGRGRGPPRGYNNPKDYTNNKKYDNPF